MVRACPSRMPRRASSTANGTPRPARPCLLPPRDARTTSTNASSPRATRTSNVRVFEEKTTLVLATGNGPLPARGAKYTMAHPVDENALAHLLTRVAEGDVSVQTALEGLRELPYEQVEGVKVDHHRELRTGQVEAVYGPGKRPEEVRAAVAALAARASGAVFVTRATPEQYEAVRE